MQIKRVGIIPRQESPEIWQIGEELVAWFAEQGIKAELDRVAAGMDMLVILGGDGTLLLVASEAAELDIPVVGINLGNLGFLTEISAGEMYPALFKILAGNIKIEQRMMLKAWKVDSDGQKTSPAFALNEVVIIKGSTSHLVKLSCWSGSEYIATYKSDGLIFATPTGSTAYNLSSGGPVVHAELQTIVVTPVCPFMLESRPVLLGRDSVISVCLAESAPAVKVLLDGKMFCLLEEEEGLQVEVSTKPLRIISSPSKGYFAILRNKLNWGGDSRDLPLPGLFKSKTV